MNSDKGKGRRPKEDRRSKPEGRRPKADSRKPKTDSRKPKDDSRKPKGKGAKRPQGQLKGKKPFNPAGQKGRSFDDEMRLNKFIAHSGVCSRREADKLIASGVVEVNGEIVTELGSKVKKGDNVHVGGEKISGEMPVYVLLNKPKDYITTTNDPQGRKTVQMLVAKAGKERIYPVGRLDRQTTGVLLFTNDGDLAEKLMHPSNNIKKVYQVTLDNNVKPHDLDKLRSGITLEDGDIKVDDIQYSGNTKDTVGLEIHSGRNRIVRRMFESLGYKVIKLDRVMFAGLTKKNLSRGKWRHLSETEVSFLKRM